MVICLEQGADLHMAQLMPLPLTVSCFSKIQIGFTFLVLAHPDSPGKRAVKRMCVCVCYSTLKKYNCSKHLLTLFNQRKWAYISSCQIVCSSLSVDNADLQFSDKFCHFVARMSRRSSLYVACLVFE